MSEQFDLIIIGGGIIGGSALYHLAELGYPGRVLLLEREDALSKGSTALSAGGFRNIWTTPINMRLTSYSIHKLRKFREELGFPIGFDQRGGHLHHARKERQQLQQRSVLR